MAITKRPQTGATRATIEKFIGAAPDAAHSDEVMQARHRKKTISLGVDALLLQKIDSFATRFGISRAATIALAMSKLVEKEP